MQNSCAHVVEQETFYIILDVDEINPVDETPEECVTTVVEGAFAFSDGRVLVAEDTNI